MNPKPSNPIARPPIIVMMGHIDHGKSTLLDYIRKTNVVGKEEGGITQHIRAYEAEFVIGEKNEKTRRKMTFLDTPGHEAFSSIRERGARIADIAILVISAEDGVKPQTLEALRRIKDEALPFIVAINKIDKPGVNVDKIKQDLAENEVLVESWGGTVPIVAVSAKTGENIMDLLEITALQADLEDLKGDPSLPAEGFVIESNLNPKEGVSAILIIKNGSLKVGSFVAAEGACAPVRGIENFKGENIRTASFSSPIKITGWNKVPKVGSGFRTFSSKEEASKFAEKDSSKKVAGKFYDTAATEGASLTVVVKADTSGSLEAVEHELKKLGNEKMAVRIISKGIGAISENDIKIANIKKSLILGFNVKAEKSSEMLALRDNIEMQTFKVIYELIDFLKEKIKSETPATETQVVSGYAKIIRIFSKNKDKQVIGGIMEDGEIKSGNTVKILRRDAPIGEGKIKELQTRKIKVDIVKGGEEFGMMIESKIEIMKGDTLKAMSLVRK